MALSISEGWSSRMSGLVMPIALMIQAWPSSISTDAGLPSNRKTRQAASGKRAPKSAARAPSRTVAVTSNLPLRDSRSTTIEPSMPDPPSTRIFVMQTISIRPGRAGGSWAPADGGRRRPAQEGEQGVLQVRPEHRRAVHEGRRPLIGLAGGEDDGHFGTRARQEPAPVQVLHDYGEARLPQRHLLQQRNLHRPEAVGAVVDRHAQED